MSRFDRYLLSQLLALFGFFALILVAVYWINRAVSLFDKLLGDGQSALVFLEFSLLLLPNVIMLVLPVATFIATVYVTNRLMQESELVVMQATGFSSMRLARPVFFFGLVVMVLHLALSNVLVPWSSAILAARQQNLSEDITARYMNAGQFMQPAKGVTLYIRAITPQGELSGVFLSDERNAQTRTIYNANRALILRSEGGPKLMMFDGTTQRLTKDGSNRLSITRFTDATLSLSDMVQSGADAGALVSPRQLTSLSLLAAGNGLNWAKSGIRDQVVREIHGRLSQPLLSLTSALLGFSILLVGAYSRFGVWRQILGAVLALIAVQFLATSATSLVEDRAHLWPVLYIAPLVGCLAALGVLWVSQQPRRLRMIAA